MGTRQDAATQAFVLKLRKDRDIPIQQYGKLLRAVASDIGEALIVGNQYGPGTPIDTGWARGNWFATIGDGNGAEHPGLSAQPIAGDRSSAGALQAAAQEVIALVVAGFGPGDILSYINNAAYIERLNNGWSQQAPAGMTDAVVARFGAIVQANAHRLGLMN